MKTNDRIQTTKMAGMADHNRFMGKLFRFLESAVSKMCRPSAASMRKLSGALALFMVIATIAGASEDKPAAHVEEHSEAPFSHEPVCEAASEARNALYKGDVQRAAELLETADNAGKGIAAMNLALHITKNNTIDPLSLFAYTHDFQESTGAFMPNGSEPPLDWLKRQTSALIHSDPASAPHLADAISLALALQLHEASENSQFIAVSDQILFSETITSAPRKMFETLACEVICSTPTARNVYAQNLMRSMLLQKIKGNLPFFGAGLWVAFKHHAKTIDPSSVERWQSTYMNIAMKLAEKGRFASGCEVIIYGAHIAPWEYLLDAAIKLSGQDDAQMIANLKIAFGYVCQASRFWKNPLPETPDSPYARLKEKLIDLGDKDHTRYAFEVSGLAMP